MELIHSGADFIFTQRAVSSKANLNSNSYLTHFVVATRTWSLISPFCYKSSSSCSVWTWGRTSSFWGWRSTGTGCPGRLWSLLLWRVSIPAWTRSYAVCCRWPCFGRRVGLDDPQRSLPTATILWFCEKHSGIPNNCKIPLCTICRSL